MAQFYTTTDISKNIKETPEGFLVCQAVKIARDGDLIYMPGETPIESGEGEQVIVHREPEDINNPETIASGEGKSITLQHPVDPVNGQGEFVDPDNFSELDKGSVQNVRPFEENGVNYLLADFLIKERKAIEAVKSKTLAEVSCGYEADYEDYGDGTGRQLNIKINHVALVDAGRCGKECAINFDHLPITIKQEGKKMNFGEIKKNIISAFSKTLDEAMPEEEKTADEKEAETKDAIDAVNARMDAMETSIKEIADSIAGKTDDAEAEAKKKADEEAKVKEAEDAKKAEDEKNADKALDQETISRAEILAPGIEKVEGVQAKSLDAFGGTPEGKKIIDSLLAGKTRDSVDTNLLFVSASELVKQQRNFDQSRPGKTVDKNAPFEPPTPEQLNDASSKRHGKA
ncbi:MAG: DUF2213 domain-containing protein [Candidatus Diapherotrites archaeon]|nr:DUF2213 domain-containing protein [Candidatus Diapherotrites archaeon]